MLTQIVVEEELRLNASAEDIYSFVTSIEGMLYFEGYGMIPGIARVEPDQEERDEGSWETVHNTDGSHHREHLLHVVPPSLYHIRIQDFVSPIRHLVTHLEETWIFTELSAKKCQFTRQFVLFTAGGWWTRWLLRNVLAPQFRRAMRRHHKHLLKRFPACPQNNLSTCDKSKKISR